MRLETYLFYQMGYIMVALLIWIPILVSFASEHIVDTQKKLPAIDCILLAFLSLAWPFLLLVTAYGKLEKAFSKG